MRTEILLLSLALAGAGPSRRQEAGGGSTPAPGRFQLDNGLTAIVRPIRGANEVALLVLYKLGGDHDPRGRSGLAHLVEHVYVTAAAGSAPARSADAFFQSYPSGCTAQTGERDTVIATVRRAGSQRRGPAR
jgi:zinc protease